MAGARTLVKTPRCEDERERDRDPNSDLERAYADHRRHVYNYFRRCGLARDASDDLTQGVFTVLVQTIGRYAPERGTLNAFLLGIARNLRRNHVKAVRRAARRALARPVPIPVGSDAEDIAMVREAVGSLPEDPREALILHEFHGLSYAEVAELQKVPIGTVRSRIARAREVLRNKLT